MINHVWKTAVELEIKFHADIAPLPELSIQDEICASCWEMLLITHWKHQNL